MKRQEIKRQSKDEKTKIIRVTCCNAVVSSSNKISTVHNKKRLYFCEEECKIEFLENPTLFINSDHFLIKFENLENE